MPIRADLSAFGSSLARHTRRRTGHIARTKTTATNTALHHGELRRGRGDEPLSDYGRQGKQYAHKPGEHLHSPRHAALSRVRALAFRSAQNACRSTLFPSAPPMTRPNSWATLPSSDAVI